LETINRLDRKVDKLSTNAKKQSAELKYFKEYGKGDYDLNINGYEFEVKDGSITSHKIASVADSAGIDVGRLIKILRRNDIEIVE
jgi:hypothetical protein